MSIRNEYSFRIAVYKIGRMMRDCELDYDSVEQLGNDLMEHSGVCRACDGDGVYTDPESGKTEDCYRCHGNCVIFEDEEIE